MTKDNVFKPSLNQISYLQALQSCTDRINKTQIAKKIGLARQTIWEWEKNPQFNKWFHEQMVESKARGLAYVYQGMEIRARKNVHDATLYLKRFDDEYSEKQEIKHKIEFDEEYSKELKKMTDKVFDDEDAKGVEEEKEEEKDDKE